MGIGISRRRRKKGKGGGGEGGEISEKRKKTFSLLRFQNPYGKEGVVVLEYNSSTEFAHKNERKKAFCNSR